MAEPEIEFLGGFFNPVGTCEIGVLSAVIENMRLVDQLSSRTMSQRQAGPKKIEFSLVFGSQAGELLGEFDETIASGRFDRGGITGASLELIRDPHA